MKHVLQTGLLALAISVLPGWAQANTALQAAVDSDLRTPAFVARDAARHPYETLRFFQIEPTHTVLEMTPGGGWYTEILAPYLRDQGQYIAAVYDGRSDVPRYQRYAQVFQDKLASRPTVFDKVDVIPFDPPGTITLAAPGSVDRVITFRNLHNWLLYGEDVLIDILRQAYVSLKPGGVLGVVEHRRPTDQPQDLFAKSGYLHEDYVIGLAERAGFQLLDSTDVNANPKDTADYPNGVWALPPTFRNGDTDRAAYAAIGESDRMTLTFIKPQ